MPFRTNAALTLSFAAIDKYQRPTTKSGISFSAGDVKISKDGGSFANTTNLPTEIGSTGRYSLSLTFSEMNASWVHVWISKSSANIDDIDLVFGTGGYPAGTVLTDAGNSASSFKTSLTEATTDHWKDSLILFTTGSLAGQLKKVSGYNGTTKFITVSAAFTGTPSNGDGFILVNI